MIDLSPYEFSLLQSGAVDLYRGRSKLGAPPLLVAARRDDTSKDAIAQLDHAYSMRAALDPHWSAQPLAITRYQDRLALAMRDPGGEALLQLTPQPLDIPRFLRVAISMVAACRRMHESGVVHRDLHPANFLVDEQLGSAWLTGFGFAYHRTGNAAHIEAIGPWAGPLQYGAPEQMGRMSQTADSRSDLYSLGITFYEMLTDALPFASDDAITLLHDHLARKPIAPHHKHAAITRRDLYDGHETSVQEHERALSKRRRA